MDQFQMTETRKKFTGIWQSGRRNELIGIQLHFRDTPVPSLDSSDDFPNPIHPEAVPTAFEGLKMTRPITIPLWVPRNPGANRRRASSRESDGIYV